MFTTISPKKIAYDWWRNELSINEQKALAKQHLKYSFEVRMVVGDYLQWVSLKHYKNLVFQIWFKNLQICQTTMTN